jgi:hypothetical protein
MVKASLSDFLKPAEEAAPQVDERPDWVKIGIKVSHDDHVRLLHLAATRRISLQRLGVAAINKELAAEGLPPIGNYNEPGP